MRKFSNCPDPAANAVRHRRGCIAALRSFRVCTPARWRNGALTAILAVVPLPSPGPSDNVIDRFVHFSWGLQHAVNAAPGAIVHFTTWAFWRLVAAALVYLIARALLPALRGLLCRERRDVLKIVPPAGARYAPESWLGFYRGLHAICPPWWKRLAVGVPAMAFEYRASGGQVTARCVCPQHLTRFVSAALHNALPGVQIDIEEAPDLSLPEGQSARARLALSREPLYPLALPRLDPLVSALGALSAAGEAILQVTLAPDPGWHRRAQRRLDALSGYGRQSLPAAVLGGVAGILLSAVSDIVEIFLGSHSAGSSSGYYGADRPTPSPKPPSYTGNLPPSEKAFGRGWRTEVRLQVWSNSRGAAKQLAHAASGSFMLLDGANSIRVKRVFMTPLFDRALAGRSGPTGTVMLLSPEELVSFFHLPVASARMAPARVRLEPLPGPRRAGAVLCRADSGELIQLAQADRRHHACLTGPTGSGKSTAMMMLALQDAADRLGVGVVDPKGDLVTDLLERIDRRDWERVVLLDPSRQQRPVGINMLDCPDPSKRELVCDSIITIFRKTYERFWGPRTEDVLRASLLTLLHRPGSTICEVPLLLLNDRVRAALTKDLGDPVGLGAFWAEYEQTSPAQRLQMVGPVLNKLRAFLLRPTVRNILGQSRSTIDFREVIDGQRILLVSLAKGTLGEETSRLMGGFLIARLWQAAMSRVALPADRRLDFNLYLDEFHNYLHLPDALGDILAEARAYRLNLTLAHQHLGQLTASVRDAVDANARTRVLFQCGQEDARQMARIFAPLNEHQLQSLDRHQVAARICVDGHVEPPFTGQMEAPPPNLGEVHSAELVRLSLDRYGRPRDQVEAEIEGRLRALGLRGGYREIA